MTLRQKSEAKRFTVMMDTFYDNKVISQLYEKQITPKKHSSKKKKLCKNFLVMKNIPTFW